MSVAKRMTVYTRGIASPSGVGGYGVILLCDGRRKELSGTAPDASNNRMDILAAVEALRALKFPCQVFLYNTNTYLTDAIRKGWAQHWRANGWKNSEKRPTPHADLWEDLLDLCAAHEVTFEYARFDPGDPEYARCDAIAHEAVRGEADRADEVAMTDAKGLEQMLPPHSPRLREILDAARERIQAGEGIPEEEFWKEVESEKEVKRQNRKQGKRPDPSW